MLRMLRPFRTLAAVVFLAIATGKVGAEEFVYKGITFVSWQPGEYTSAQAIESLNELQATGANWAGLLVTWYQADKTATTIERQPTTPDDGVIADTISNMHARGLKVFLKPHVDAVNGEWRGEFLPSDVDAWFASYRTFILHYADIAEANNVEMLSVGTEFKLFTGAAYRTHWANLIAEIRQHYSGKLTYSSHAAAVGDEYETLSFWDLLDVLGYNCYFKLTGINNPTLQNLIDAWTSNVDAVNIIATLRDFQASVGLPAVFTEIGYRSTDGTNMSAGTYEDGDLDFEEQAMCYESFFRAFAGETAWLKGAFWWGWEARDVAEDDEHYSPNNKPALEVLKQYYGVPVITSGPAANPNPAEVGQEVLLSVAAYDANGDELTYAWDLGDGSTADESAVFHTYASAGAYIVTVTVTDDDGNSATATIDVTVVVGGGVAFPVNLSKARGKLNFAKQNKDSIIVSGMMEDASGLTLDGMTITVDICGVTATFVTDAKGNAKTDILGNKYNRFKLKLKMPKGGTVEEGKFQVSLKKGNFSATLANAGMVNETTPKEGKPVQIRVIIDAGGRVYQGIIEVLYKAKREKSGKFVGKA